MKNVASSQPCISINFSTEYSKAQALPWEYHYSQKTETDLKINSGSFCYTSTLNKQVGILKNTIKDCQSVKASQY